MSNDPMLNAVILIWGFVLAAGVILLLDWYGRRKDRRSKQRPPV